MESAYKKGFIPYAFAAFLIGIVGGFSTVLGPAFTQDIGISYSNVDGFGAGDVYGIMRSDFG